MTPSRPFTGLVSRRASRVGRPVAAILPVVAAGYLCLPASAATLPPEPVVCTCVPLPAPLIEGGAAEGWGEECRWDDLLDKADGLLLAADETTDAAATASWETTPIAPKPVTAAVGGSNRLAARPVVAGAALSFRSGGGGVLLAPVAGPTGGGLVPSPMEPPTQSVPPIPLPAAAWMLLAALVGLVVLALCRAGRGA